MLVLTRRVGEAIVIGGTIRVTILAVQGNKARIGVKAPDSVRVDRVEVHDRRSQCRAVRPQPPRIASATG